MICRFANGDLITLAILKIGWPQSVGPVKKNTCNTVLLGELLKSITAILFVLQFAQQADCYMNKICLRQIQDTVWWQKCFGNIVNATLNGKNCKTLLYIFFIFMSCFFLT